MSLRNVPPNFEFRSQVIHVAFDSGPQFLEALAKDDAPDSELKRRVVTGDQRAMFASATGGTQVFVDQGAANGQTRYFGPFSQTDSWALRTDYSLRKLGFLLAKIEGAGGRPLMVGLRTVANYPVKEEDREPLKAILAKDHVFSFGKLNPGDQLVDFSLRVSRTIRNSFLNVHLSWYQIRSFSMPVPIGSVGSSVKVSFRDWEGQLDEEGLEIQLELNNKAGLMAGKLDWTVNELLDEMKFGLSVFPDTFANLMKSLVVSDDRLNGGGQ